MNRPKRRVVIGIMAAVVAVGLVAVARNAIGCGTRYEENLIEQFQADPFLATAPPDGLLVEDSAQAGTCQEEENPTAEYLGGVTSVRRVYETPAIYNVDQLRQLFDQSAEVGGWSFEADIALSHPAHPSIAPNHRVTYCRQTGSKVFYATAVSPAGPTLPERSVRVGIRTSVPTNPCGSNSPR